MKRFSFLILLSSIVLTNCEQSSPDSSVLDKKYLEDHDKWKEKRLDELTAEEGYLSLAGFYWLENGTYRVGSGKDMDIVFPPESSDPYIGDLVVKEDSMVSFQNAENIEITLNGENFVGGPLNSNGSKSSKLRHLRSQFYPIVRNEKLALRLEWFDTPSRTLFKGLDYFDINPDMIIAAKFERYEETRKVRIGNVKDYVSTEISEGELVFNLFGEEYRLQSMAEESEGRFFIIFGDKTNGDSTYGGGRFIWVDAPNDDGDTIIDFNKAYNPACAFTVFSTCPIPPDQNRISGSIIAGERSYTST